MKIIYSILAVTFMLAFSSCEKIIDLDLRTIEPRLVIEATIGEAMPCVVLLSQTQDYYDNSFPTGVSGIITLTDDKGNVETLFEVSQGVYSSNMTGVANSTYTINVKVADKEYTSIATMPETVLIDSLYIYNMQIAKENFYSPCVIYDDPLNIKNYYYATVYVNDKRLRTIYLNNDEYNDGVKEIHDILFYNGSDAENKDDEDSDELKIGDNIRVEMKSINQGAYDYYISLFSVASGGGTNPISNFSGGVLGCFTTYGLSTSEITISEDNIFTKDQIK